MSLERQHPSIDHVSERPDVIIDNRQRRLTCDMGEGSYAKAHAHSYWMTG